MSWKWNKTDIIFGTRPRALSRNKLTDDIDGILTFQSDGRAVEIFVLTPIDKNGLPDMTKFKEDNDNDNAYYNLSSMKYFSFLASFGKLAYLDLSNKPL